VITLGRATDSRHLLLSPGEYARRGVEVVETDRGGDVTWHGPGQLVGYPIVDLRARDLGPRTFLRRLEGSLIDLLSAFGVEGHRIPGLTGVFAGEEKIAALGIRVARGVSLHGFALNVSTGPAAFEGIVPCGIRDRGVTSLDRLVSPAPDLPEVARRYPPFLEAALTAHRDEGPDR
jgi:lipoate-protein ligase B